MDQQDGKRKDLTTILGGPIKMNMWIWYLSMIKSIGSLSFIRLLIPLRAAVWIHLVGFRLYDIVPV